MSTPIKTQPPCIDCGTLGGFYNNRTAGDRIPWRIGGRCHACYRRARRRAGGSDGGNPRGHCEVCGEWGRLAPVDGVALCARCRAEYVALVRAS